MSTYVTLVNLLLTRLNEVPLDLAGDGFSSVRGVHALAKNAINNSLRQIYQEAQEWPFLKTSYVETLSPSVKEYTYPVGYSSSDTDTFYLKKNLSLNNQASYLPTIGYEEYVKNFRAIDDDGKTGAPELIYQTYENKFGVSPVPDQAYEIEYVYWSTPEDLTLYDDECIVPSRFNYIIVDGAMMYLMRFRSNDQGAATHQQSFESGIKAMRRVLLDDPKHLRSTVISGRG